MTKPFKGSSFFSFPPYDSGTRLRLAAPEEGQESSNRARKVVHRLITLPDAAGTPANSPTENTLPHSKPEPGQKGRSTARVLNKVSPSQVSANVSGFSPLPFFLATCSEAFPWSVFSASCCAGPGFTSEPTARPGHALSLCRSHPSPSPSQ